MREMKDIITRIMRHQLKKYGKKAMEQNKIDWRKYEKMS